MGKLNSQSIIFTLNSHYNVFIDVVKDWLKLSSEQVQQIIEVRTDCRAQFFGFIPNSAL